MIEIINSSIDQINDFKMDFNDGDIFSLEGRFYCYNNKYLKTKILPEEFKSIFTSQEYHFNIAIFNKGNKYSNIGYFPIILKDIVPNSAIYILMLSDNVFELKKKYSPTLSYYLKSGDILVLKDLEEFLNEYEIGFKEDKKIFSFIHLLYKTKNKKENFIEKLNCVSKMSDITPFQKLKAKPAKSKGKKLTPKYNTQNDFNYGQGKLIDESKTPLIPFEKASLITVRSHHLSMGSDRFLPHLPPNFSNSRIAEEEFKAAETDPEIREKLGYLFVKRLINGKEVKISIEDLL